jgi:SAM-dependent methyltransferase
MQEPGKAGGRITFGHDLREAVVIFRMALRVRRDPRPLIRRVSQGTVDYLSARGIDVRGRRLLEVGTGGGALAEALAEDGASVVGLDLQDHRRPGVRRTPFVASDAAHLPFADATFDGTLTSNVLEHVPDPWALIDELVRVALPGGFVYLSWTTWYSPLGGHEMSPFHYLGPKAGLRAYRAVRGKMPAWNVPGETLFVVHAGQILKGLRARGDVEVRDMVPRYWPSMWFLGRVPGVREVALWNCVILLQKTSAGAAVRDAASGPT